MSSIEHTDLESLLVDNECLSKDELRSRLEDQANGGFFDESKDAILESEVNDLFAKISEIAQIYGEKVFRVDNANGVIYFDENFKAKSEYWLCLFRMRLGQIQTSDNTQKKTAKLFEEIAAKAIQKYLGDNAEYVLIDTESNVDIEEIFQKILLEKHHPNIRENFEQYDLKTDIIAWKRIDERAGKIILLVECKGGKQWRREGVVNENAWAENIGDFSAAPIKAFCIADLLVDTDELHRCGKQRGIIFDRARIIRLLAQADSEGLQKIRKRIKMIRKSCES